MKEEEAASQARLRDAENRRKASFLEVEVKAEAAKQAFLSKHIALANQKSAFEAKAKDNRCFKCSETSHYVPNCPNERAVWWFPCPICGQNHLRQDCKQFLQEQALLLDSANNVVNGVNEAVNKAAKLEKAKITREVLKQDDDDDDKG